MAKVTLKNVSKNFGSIAAVQNMNLEIQDGEFVVLLGPSGVGKTTTLRLIGGLETSDKGQIHIGDTNVTNVPIADRDVAFVFQQYSLYPHYTVFENMAFPLKSPLRKHAWSKQAIKAEVERMAEMLAIDHKLNNKATQLSGGEMQRVAIGRALIRDAKIYLMDEPLSSLDAKLRESLRVELKRIQKEKGATILYVTHDQIEAMTLADRIGVLRAGELVQIDTPKTIYKKPANVYVAQRLGSPPINLLSPDFTGVDKPARTHQIGLRPEQIRLSEPNNPSATGSEISALVKHVEPLGAETILLLEAHGEQFRALADTSRLPSVNDVVNLNIKGQHCLNFDSSGSLLESAI